MTALQQLAGSQASSRASGRNVTTSKSVARSAVLDDLDAISLNARALALRTPGLEDKFRLPRNQSDQLILASARAFIADALPLRDQFMALHMSPTFLEDIQADIDEFEKTLTARRQTRSAQVSATASMDSALSRGIDIVQELRAVVHNTLSASTDDRAGRMAPSEPHRQRLYAVGHASGRVSDREARYYRGQGRGYIAGESVSRIVNVIKGVSRTNDFMGSHLLGASLCYKRRQAM